MEQNSHDANNEATLDLSQKKSSKKVSNTSSTTPIRVKKNTQKEIKKILTKINKKAFGKKVKADDLLELSLSLIDEKHIKKLQDASLSNADRLEMGHKEYCKIHGNISKDEYIGTLLNAKNSAVRGTSE